MTKTKTEYYIWNLKTNREIARTTCEALTKPISKSFEGYIAVVTEKELSKLKAECEK